MGYILTLFSAIIYFYSFPPYTAGYAAFLSLTPFFYALTKTDSIIKAALTGLIWGTALSVLLSIPLYNALITEYDFTTFFSTLLIIITVYLPYAIVYSLFGISFKFFYEKAGIYFPVFAASIWILIDYSMSILPIFIPWGFAGYTQTFNRFIQIIDITGIYGVSFLVVLINSLVIDIILHNKYYVKLSILIILIISSSTIYGYLRIENINKSINSSNNKLTAAVIQGNFSSDEKWDKNNTSAVINTYINLTKKIIGKADIIVWPETVLNSSDAYNLDVLTGISSLLNPDQIFISGAIRNDGRNNTYNSIFTAGRNGLYNIYDKKILFPYTETSLAGFSSGKFLDSPSIFLNGKSKPAYKSNLAAFGFTICFEAIYPDYVRRIKNLGAEVLVNVANDSWFGNTYEPQMHLHSIIARAIENRIYVIRSSNTGISAVISPAGELLSTIKLNIRDTTTASISIINIPSIYSKSGDWIIVFSLLLIIFALVYLLLLKN